MGCSLRVLAGIVPNRFWMNRWHAYWSSRCPWCIFKWVRSFASTDENFTFCLLDCLVYWISYCSHCWRRSCTSTVAMNVRCTRRANGAVYYQQLAIQLIILLRFCCPHFKRLRIGPRGPQPWFAKPMNDVLAFNNRAILRCNQCGSRMLLFITCHVIYSQRLRSIAERYTFINK